MNIIDHGKWTRYYPSRIAEDMPPNALYARRDTDLKDWYDFLWKDKVLKHETVKATAVWTDNMDAFVIGAAVYDGSMLFPHDSYVLEIEDYTGVDPQNDLGGKSYNPDSKTIGAAPELKIEPSAFETKVLTALDSIITRIEKLEKKKSV